MVSVPVMDRTHPPHLYRVYQIRLHRVRGVIPACIDWMVQTIATNAETAYERANPITIKKKLSTPIKDRLTQDKGVSASDTIASTTSIARFARRGHGRPR